MLALAVATEEVRGAGKVITVGGIVIAPDGRGRIETVISIGMAAD